MSLFRKKCGHCGNKIEKNKEVFKDVKVPGFTGTRQRAFCCENCIKNYEKGAENCVNKAGRSCCG